MQANLFLSLFDFHPREGLTPKENFLSESFAHVLRVDSAALSAFLGLFFQRKVIVESCEISTRRAERDSGGERAIYPDMVVTGEFGDGDSFCLYSEHKWDAPCSIDQLEEYGKLVKRVGATAKLVFIGATRPQRDEALKCLDPKECLLWEDVYRSLNAVSEPSNVLKEFLSFMKQKGLSPGEPITIAQMKAFLEATGFLSKLMRYAEKLNSDYDWKFIPVRYHGAKKVNDAYGRVGIRFYTKNSNPMMALGFLYDESEYKVTLVDRQRGIDLVLCISADPKRMKSTDSIMKFIDGKSPDLHKSASSVQVIGKRGNPSNWSVVLIRECLANVIGDAAGEDEQIERIYSRLSEWVRILFSDGELEIALKQAGLDSE